MGQKKELFNVLENPNDMLVAIDMDGVICNGIFWTEDDDIPKPNHEFIDYMWGLYRKGAHIIVYTARQPRYYAITHAWLLKHEVPFHGIAMLMKPGADVYIDDKALNLDDVST